MKVLKISISIIAVGILWLVYQLFLPTLSLAYFDGAVYIAFCLLVIAGVVGLWLSEDIDEYNYAIPGIGLIVIIVVFLICSIAGSALFNHSTMYNQIGEIEEKSFLNDIVEIDNSQIPTVDIELATKLADKKLGEDVGLGSQMEVGTFTNKQSVDGKLVYVAPLEHTGFWKWNSNSDGTIGYVVVSATNSSDVKLVKEVNGESLKLKYIECILCF